LTSLSKVVAETFDYFQRVDLDKTVELLTKKKNCIADFILRSPFIPGSNLRELAEFKILEIQFLLAYSFPPSFYFQHI